MSPKVSPATMRNNKGPTSRPIVEKKKQQKTASLQSQPTSVTSNRRGAAVPARAPQLKSSSRLEAKGGRAGKKAGNKTAVSRAPILRNGRRPSSAGLPYTHPTKGLSMPKPHSSTADQIQQRLKNKSPWYQSLMDPLHGADVKIPDSTGFETGTLQLVHRDSFTMQTAPGGAACGIRITCPLPNLSGSGPSSFNYQFTDLSSSVTAVVWSNVAFAFDTSPALLAYAQGVRPVSACLCVQSLASLADNSGYMVGYLEAYGDALFANTHPIGDYQNNYKSAVIPLNNNKPICVKYIPVKANGGQYDMFYPPNNPVGTAVSQTPFYEMGVIAVGVPAGTVFEVQIVVNYEFIPSENAINILDATPSPVDAQEVDLVENWVQSTEVVSIIPTAMMSSSPSTSPLEEPGQGTGFGMWAETIMEIAPILLGAIL